MNKPLKTFSSNSQLMDIEVGPSHPAMHGIVHFRLKLDGEKIVAAETEIGYLHRAFEKQAENCHYVQVLPYTDRLNYCSAIINNCGYSMTVEKLFGIKPPKRAEYARVIMMEIARLSDHMTCLGAVAMELGGFTVFLWFIKAREYLWELIEEFTGARLTTSWTRFGGNAHDFPETFLPMLEERLSKVQEVIDECDTLITRNKIFMDRVKGVGILSLDQAISFGFSGPMLRACGYAHDLRTAEPYSVYSDFDFTIPVGSVGDCYDRFLVRMEEMRQSIHIIRQAKAKIPAEGGHTIRHRHAALPPKDEAYGSIEGMIDHFKLIMEGHCPPAGEAYQAVEAANGELGFYIVSDGTGKPQKVRVRPPCFNFVAAMEEMIVGHNLADLIPIFGSINMIGGELDR